MQGDRSYAEISVDLKQQIEASFQAWKTCAVAKQKWTQWEARVEEDEVEQNQEQEDTDPDVDGGAGEVVT